MATSRICSVEGCGKAVYRKSTYCQGHHRRVERHGNPCASVAFGSFPVRATAKDWVAAHLGHSGDACLIWPFKRDAAGYGSWSKNGSTTPAARMICEKVYGPPPSPIHQCAHSCGQGRSGCVNPRHLRWATPTENYKDRRIHGTDDAGDRNPRAKLSWVQVEEIRLNKDGLSNSKLAALYGVSGTWISSIQRKLSWKTS